MRIGKLPVVVNANIIATPEDATFDLIYRLSTDGIVYGKKSDGTSYPIGGGLTIAAVGTVSFPGGGPPGVDFIDTAVPEALTTSIVLITAKAAGGVSGQTYSYEVAVNGTLRLWTSNISITADVDYTIINQ